MEEVDAFLREEVGFRPLAGFWFLNSAQFLRVCLEVGVFPSPCGVLVLK